MSAPKQEQGDAGKRTKKRSNDRGAPFFATENPDDEDAMASVRLREAELGLFGRYAGEGEESCGQFDEDHEVARMGMVTGLRKAAVERGIFGYMALRDLPKLRALQFATSRLDAERLSAIAAVLNALGNNATPEAFAAFDDELVGLFTPDKTNQQLPAKNSITLRLNKLIGDFDSAAAFDQKRRAEREKQPPPIPPGHCELTFMPSSQVNDRSGMFVEADNATMASVRAFVDATAREHGLTHSDAFLKLTTGQLTPAAQATIFGYAPKRADGTIDESASVFIPGFGFTGAVGTAVFHAMATFGGKVVDMDHAATRSVNGYVAPDDIKAYCRGRDGTCIFPGCTRSAWQCQLDHRIPFDEGGATTASNLYSLCQHHHNVKTDKRAFYIPDPVTGEIVWLFPDGTYHRVDPDGVISQNVTPTSPKWASTLDDAVRRHRATANFFAQCHAILDRYETEREFTHGDCIQALSELEKFFGKKFPYHPVPPVEEPVD